MDDKIIYYKYRFVFAGGNEQIINLRIDKASLKIIDEEETEKPEWAKQENFKCPGTSCKLVSSDYCPLAVNINKFIKMFSNIPSYEKVNVFVEAYNRTYVKETSLQDAFGGLLGIIMPTSGCPTLGKLKPLVKFHLPFASIEETEFRVFSMYMLAQYLRMKKGKEPDWEMKNLVELYEEIQKINRNIAKNIADLEKMDASINSVIVLNNFADSVTFSLEENLSQFEKLFSNWLD